MIIDCCAQSWIMTELIIFKIMVAKIGSDFFPPPPSLRFGSRCSLCCDLPLGRTFQKVSTFRINGTDNKTADYSLLDPWLINLALGSRRREGGGSRIYIRHYMDGAKDRYQLEPVGLLNFHSPWLVSLCTLRDLLLTVL